MKCNVCTSIKTAARLWDGSSSYALVKVSLTKKFPYFCSLQISQPFFPNNSCVLQEDPALRLPLPVRHTAHLEQHCYDWHCALAIPSRAPFPIVIPQRCRFCSVLPHSPRNAMTTQWKKRKKKAWRSPKASSVEKGSPLASADDGTVSFIFHDGKKKEEKIEQGR